MDLSTVSQKLDEGAYKNIRKDFPADCRLVFENAILYNPAGEPVHDMAVELKKFFDTLWATTISPLVTAAADCGTSIGDVTKGKAVVADSGKSKAATTDGGKGKTASDAMKGKAGGGPGAGLKSAEAGQSKNVAGSAGGEKFTIKIPNKFAEPVHDEKVKIKIRNKAPEPVEDEKIKLKIRLKPADAAAIIPKGSTSGQGATAVPGKRMQTASHRLIEVANDDAGGERSAAEGTPKAVREWRTSCRKMLTKLIMSKVCVSGVRVQACVCMHVHVRVQIVFLFGNCPAGELTLIWKAPDWTHQRPQILAI